MTTALATEDHGSLVKEAARHPGRVLRFLNSRLYSGKEAETLRVVRALGAVVRETNIVSGQRATDLLRRYVWALNDESGAVPYGVPEAIGEVLAVRPEFQEAFLPILCSLLTEEEMSQAGPVERGAMWAVGRLGAVVPSCSPEAVAAVRRAAVSHPDQDVRAAAVRALKQIEAAER